MCKELGWDALKIRVASLEASSEVDYKHWPCVGLKGIGPMGPLHGGALNRAPQCKIEHPYRALNRALEGPIPYRALYVFWFGCPISLNWRRYSILPETVKYMWVLLSPHRNIESCAAKAL